MPSGRLPLKYFSRADLRPLPQSGGMGPRRPLELLSENECEDLRCLVRNFSQDGDVVIDGDDLAQKPHVRAFILVLGALGALRLEEISAGYRLRATGRLARHLPEIL